MNSETTDDTIKSLDYSSQLRDVNEQLLISSIKLQEMAEIARSMEQRLQDIVSGLNAVVCEVDIVSGSLTFLSLKTSTFLGHSPEIWRDTPAFLLDIVHPSEVKIVAELLQQKSGNVDNFIYDFRGISDSEEPVYLRNIVRAVQDSSGLNTNLRCLIIDVTEEKGLYVKMHDAFNRSNMVTESLQRAILYMPAEGSFPGLTVSRLYEAASDEANVGGDFFDTFACNYGHIALILGDVMGHGLPAAMFTAELKFALRAFTREHAEPERILMQMNSYLCESARLFSEGLFDEGSSSPLCISIIIIDTNSWIGQIASAGMESSLLVRNDGSIEELESGGLLLGLQPGSTYEQTQFTMEPGDSLVMVTDGITEARHEGEFLELDGLRKLVYHGWTKGSLKEIASAIIDGAKEFGHGIRRDDACVLLARRHL